MFFQELFAPAPGFLLHQFTSALQVIRKAESLYYIAVQGRRGILCLTMMMLMIPSIGQWASNENLTD